MLQRWYLGLSSKRANKQKQGGRRGNNNNNNVRINIIKSDKGNKNDNENSKRLRLQHREQRKRKERSASNTAVVRTSLFAWIHSLRGVLAAGSFIYSPSSISSFTLALALRCDR